MKNWFCALLIMIPYCSGLYAESITERDKTYREICLKAATDPWYFQNFRSLPDYTQALEIGGGGEFADFLRKNGTQETLENVFSLQRLDEFGNPSKNFFSDVGEFSATTLRYIVIADHIKRIFSLSDDSKIAEIGAGFGGQCFILSQLQPFSKYYIYDLPEVEALIEKMLHELAVDNFTCMPLNSDLTESNIDLVISNYAFSECGRSTQLDYFDRVIKKSTRGYIIYNQIAGPVYGIDCLSVNEFLALLTQEGMNPKVYNEPIVTHADNILIVWDRTQ